MRPRRANPPSLPRPGLRRPALRCAVAAALLLAAGAAPAEVDPLRLDPRVDLPVTAGAAFLALALDSKYTAPSHCRWCEPGRFDAWARRELVWRDTSSARLASDIVASGVLPVGVLLNSFLSARRGGDPEAFWEDALIIAEATALTADLHGATSDLVARRRPEAGLSASGASDRSFVSGHSSLAFSLAAAAGTVSTLRGYPSAPWVWAGGMTLATGVAYLRVAGDAHWATDVLTGAAVGGMVGFAVPWLFHRVRRRGRPRVLPAPGGFALLF